MSNMFSTSSLQLPILNPYPAPPTNPNPGDMYYNTITRSPQIFDGARWLTVGVDFSKQKHLTGYGTKSGKKYRYPGEIYADK